MRGCGLAMSFLKCRSVPNGVAQTTSSVTGTSRLPTTHRADAVSGPVMGEAGARREGARPPRRTEADAPVGLSQGENAVSSRPRRGPGHCEEAGLALVGEIKHPRIHVSAREPCKRRAGWDGGRRARFSEPDWCVFCSGIRQAGLEPAPAGELHVRRDAYDQQPQLFLLVAARLAAVPDGRARFRGGCRSPRRTGGAGGASAALALRPGAAPDPWQDQRVGHARHRGIPERGEAGGEPLAGVDPRRAGALPGRSRARCIRGSPTCARRCR